MTTTGLGRVLFAIILALASLAQLGPAPAAAQGDGERAEVLVRLNPSVDVKAFARRTGLVPLDQLGRLPIYRLAIVDGLAPKEKAAQLSGRPGVLAAEPNQDVLSPWAQRRSTWVVGEGVVDEGVVDEPQEAQARRRSTWVVSSSVDEYVAQWAPERLGLAVAHTVTKGAGVTVAILDTGVDLDHPALAGRLAEGYDFVDADAEPREEGSAATDAAFGHGTHVAGLVALVAPEAQILPLRTLRPDGSGDLWTQIVAMHYALERGAQVINLSFSFGERSLLFDRSIAAVTCVVPFAQTCRGSRAAGAVVVAAAGNSGTQVREFPGASPSPALLGVAATTSDDRLAAFSTYGAWLPLAAPGEAIVSTVPGGGYEAWSGTSMATPLAAGTAALVRSAYPWIGPSLAARQVVETAAPISAVVSHRVNAAAAVGPLAP
jgi:subtilisin family serine protease